MRAGTINVNTSLIFSLFVIIQRVYYHFLEYQCFSPGRMFRRKKLWLSVQPIEFSIIQLLIKILSLKWPALLTISSQQIIPCFFISWVIVITAYLQLLGTQIHNKLMRQPQESLEGDKFSFIFWIFFFPPWVYFWESLDCRTLRKRIPNLEASVHF